MRVEEKGADVSTWMAAKVASQTVPKCENKTSTNWLSVQEVSARTHRLGRRWDARVAYKEKVPVKFGQLGRLSGLYFGCTGCARGTLFTAIELVQRYGTEGRVADLARRLACKFCKQNRRRAPRVYVEVSRPFYTKGEVAVLTASNLDALLYKLQTLKPPNKIS